MAQSCSFLTDSYKFPTEDISVFKMPIFLYFSWHNGTSNLNCIFAETNFREKKFSDRIKFWGNAPYSRLGRYCHWILTAEYHPVCRGTTGQFDGSGYHATVHADNVRNFTNCTIIEGGLDIISRSFIGWAISVVLMSLHVAVLQRALFSHKRWSR